MEMNLKSEVSPEAKSAFQEASGRVRAGQCARRLWTLLTPSERAQLGGDLANALQEYRNAPGMWLFLRGVGPKRAVIDVAHRLGFLTPEIRDWLIREFDEPEGETDAILHQAMQSVRLVLVTSTREVYWNHEQVAIDWGQKHQQWRYFEELCRAASQRRTIDGETFNKPGPRHIVIQKNRLRSIKGFPRDLHKLIVSGEFGSQRLDLPPDQIRVFEIELTETLRGVN